MHPKLSSKLAASGQAPAPKAFPGRNAGKQAAAHKPGPKPGPKPGSESDSVLIQRIRVVYRGDTERHIELLRRAGLLGDYAPPPPQDSRAKPQAQGQSEAKRAPKADPDPLFPLTDVAKAPDKPFTLPEENEVARRIQMAMSSTD